MGEEEVSITPEDKLIAMLETSEKQQDAVTRLIEGFHKEAAQARERHSEIRQLHLETIDTQKKEFNAALLRLHNEYKKHYSWLVTLKHSLIVASPFLVFVIGFWFYSDHQAAKLADIEQAMKELVHYDAEIMTCTHNDKKYPCIRVMKSWGGFGRGDIYIIDPKSKPPLPLE